MNKSYPPALVTCARGRAAYAVIKSLAARGVPVYAADYTPRAMAFYSRYIEKAIVYPSPFQEPDRFIDCLNRVRQQYGIEVLLPVMEETYTIARHRDRIDPGYRTALMSYDALIGLHDKGNWISRAMAGGISVPCTLPLERALDPASHDSIRYPVLIKPKQGGGGWGIQQYSTRGELVARIKDGGIDGIPISRYHLQEKIEGMTLGVAALFDKGRPIATMAYEQLRKHPEPFGQATLRRTTCHPVAEAALRSFLSDQQWHGVCQADFIVDRETGRPYLIDVNPRIWGSVALSVAAGVDIPFLLYRMALGEYVREAPTCTPGVFSRWLGGDLATLRFCFWRFRSVCEADNDLKRGDHAVAYDDFSLRDPIPFVAWCADTLVSSVLSKALRRPLRDSLSGIWSTSSLTVAERDEQVNSAPPAPHAHPFLTD